MLQENLLGGPPPLGPGAPPAQRLAAFYAAMVDLLEQHAPLVLGAETGASRFATGAYGFWRAHLRALLRAGGVESREALIEPLLAPLAPEVYLHQRRTLGLAPAQITAALGRLAEGMLGGGGAAE